MRLKPTAAILMAGLVPLAACSSEARKTTSPADAILKRLDADFGDNFDVAVVGRTAAKGWDTLKLDDGQTVYLTREGSEQLIPQDKLTAYGNIILRTVKNKSTYSAIILHGNSFDSPISTVPVHVQERPAKDHLLVTANGFPETAFAHPAPTTMSNTLNLDEPTISFVFPSENPNRQVYKGTDISAVKGSEIVELCQALILANPENTSANDPATVKEFSILGNETFCNGLTRSIIFADQKEPYDQHVKNIQSSPLELGVDMLGLNVPYLRVQQSDYEAILRGDTSGTASFVNSQDNLVG